MKKIENESLFENQYTHELVKIELDKLELVEVKYTSITPIQKQTSKAIWRPAPGRKFAFVLKHNKRLIGILFFASPVISITCRDEYLNLKNQNKPKGVLLRNYIDLSVCVGFQPLAWHWNIGKLLALSATCKEVSDYYENKYGDKLIGITTTSLWGRGSQYNRVYKYLGETKGYGHQHISDEEYDDMLKYMKEKNIEIPSCKFGSGSNARMRRIAAYKKAIGEKVDFIHGNKRGVYYHPCEQKTFQQICKYWYDKFGLKRYEAKKNEIPPYQNGLE